MSVPFKDQGSSFGFQTSCFVKVRLLAMDVTLVKSGTILRNQNIYYLEKLEIEMGIKRLFAGLQL